MSCEFRDNSKNTHSLNEKKNIQSVWKLTFLQQLYIYIHIYVSRDMLPWNYQLKKMLWQMSWELCIIQHHWKLSVIFDYERKEKNVWIYMKYLFFNSTDGQIKQEIRGEAAANDVVYVKTEPATDGHCRCIDLAPMHFNAPSSMYFHSYVQLLWWTQGWHSCTSVCHRPFMFSLNAQVLSLPLRVHLDAHVFTVE